MNKLVSVVVPSYNSGRFLSEALSSILEQTYRNYEILVVDDGSTDDTEDICKSFGDSLTYIRQDNAGAGAARNRGLIRAAGEYIAFLDADDIWMSGKLQRQVEHLEGNPSCDIVFTHGRKFTSPDYCGETTGEQEVFPALIPSSALIRRCCFEKAGLLPEDKKLGEFIEWHSVAVSKGLKSELLDDILLLRRLHGSNTSMIKKDNKSDYLRILKGNIDRKRKRKGG